MSLAPRCSSHQLCPAFQCGGRRGKALNGLFWGFWGSGLPSLSMCLRYLSQLPSLYLLPWPAGCQAVAHAACASPVPSPGPPPSHHHVLLQSVQPLWPDPAGQQLQRGLCAPVPGLPGGDPALSRGGHPAWTHSQLLPPEHHRGILSICSCWERSQCRRSPHLLWQLLGIWEPWLSWPGQWVQPTLPPLQHLPQWLQWAVLEHELQA